MWAFEKFTFELDALCPYNFKITCNLLRLLISLKTMLVLPAKFTILISWSPICIPLDLLKEIGKYWTKGSDERLFIFILDWMLVNAILIMWRKFSPHPNIYRVKKRKNPYQLYQRLWDNDHVMNVKSIYIYIYKMYVIVCNLQRRFYQLLYMRDVTSVL